MAGVDTNRTTAGVLLPPVVASEIWADAAEQSVVMQRVPKTPLPGSGKQIQVITGDGVAQFVTETGRKPVSDPTFANKTLRPYKIALTQSFSDEFRRDKAALYAALRPRMATSIAKTFDQAVLHGVGAPTGDFDTLEAAPAGPLTSPIYDKFLAGLQSVTAAGGDVDAWLLSGQGEVAILGETDTAGRPLFTSNMQTDGSIGSVLGRPVWRSKNVYLADTPVETGGAAGETLGFGGEWASAAWGAVEGIKYEEYGGPIYGPTGTLVHAGRQDNMFSVICEIEVGFIVRDVNRFYRFTGTDA